MSVVPIIVSTKYVEKISLAATSSSWRMNHPVIQEIHQCVGGTSLALPNFPLSTKLILEAPEQLCII